MGSSWKIRVMNRPGPDGYEPRSEHEQLKSDLAGVYVGWAIARTAVEPQVTTGG